MPIKGEKAIAKDFLIETETQSQLACLSINETESQYHLAGSLIEIESQFQLACSSTS